MKRVTRGKWFSVIQEAAKLQEARKNNSSKLKITKKVFKSQSSKMPGTIQEISRIWLKQPNSLVLEALAAPGTTEVPVTTLEKTTITTNGFTLEIKPLVVPADSGTRKTPLVGWDFSEFCVLSGLFSTWKPTQVPRNEWGFHWPSGNSPVFVQNVLIFVVIVLFLVTFCYAHII